MLSQYRKFKKNLVVLPLISGILLGGKPIDNLVNQEHPVPAQTDLSVRLAKDLKKRGFRFLGPTMVYSFMQASGLVNDHEETCAFKLITTKRR